MTSTPEQSDLAKHEASACTIGSCQRHGKCMYLNHPRCPLVPRKGPPMNQPQSDLSSLIERLKDWAPGVTAVRKDCLEAADRLEKMRSALFEVQTALPVLATMCRTAKLPLGERRAMQMLAAVEAALGETE